MKLSEVKRELAGLEAVNFQLEDGSRVPEHFHVTEVGVVTKHFIDCGGTIRNEKVANFQLWDANDFEHRLKPGKLLDIIALSEKMLGMEDLEIEVEYQTATIGKYHLGFEAGNFILKSTYTDCLARENCGIPTNKLTTVLTKEASCCSPASGCCS
jgi:hypothetical protein